MNKKLHSMFFPAPLVVEDESVMYRRRLAEARKRQQERDEMHMAWLDNLFHGEKYVSILEELPPDLTPEKQKNLKRILAKIGHPKYDAGA